MITMLPGGTCVQTPLNSEVTTDTDLQYHPLLLGCVHERSGHGRFWDDTNPLVQMCGRESSREDTKDNRLDFLVCHHP